MEQSRNHRRFRDGDRIGERYFGGDQPDTITQTQVKEPIEQLRPWLDWLFKTPYSPLTPTGSGVTGGGSTTEGTTGGTTTSGGTTGTTGGTTGSSTPMSNAIQNAPVTFGTGITEADILRLISDKYGNTQPADNPLAGYFLNLK